MRVAGPPAIQLKTFEQLERFVRAFAFGPLDLIVLLGVAGLRKCSIVRAAVGESAACI